MATNNNVGKEEEIKHKDNGITRENVSNKIKISALEEQINEVNTMNNHEVLVKMTEKGLKHELNGLNKTAPEKKLTCQNTSLDKENSLSIESSNDSNTSQVPENSKADVLTSKVNKHQDSTKTIEKNKVTNAEKEITSKSDEHNQESINTIENFKQHVSTVAKTHDNDELEYSHLDDILDKQLNSINNNVVARQLFVDGQNNVETIVTNLEIVKTAVQSAKNNIACDEDNENKSLTEDIKDIAADSSDNAKDENDAHIEVKRDISPDICDDEKSIDNDGRDTNDSCQIDNEITGEKHNNYGSSGDDDKSKVDNSRGADDECQIDNESNGESSNSDGDEKSTADAGIGADDEIDEDMMENEIHNGLSDYDSDVDYMELALQFIEREPIVKVERSQFFSCKFCYQGFLDGHAYELHCLTHVTFQKIQPPDQQKKPKFKPDDLYKPIHDCPDCDASFVQISTLQTHAALHAPKPNICRCGIGYYKKQDLFGHIKVVHNNNVSDWVEKSEDNQPPYSKKSRNKEKSKALEAKEEKPKKIITIYEDDDYIEKDDSDKDSVVSNWASRNKKTRNRKTRNSKKKNKNKHKNSKTDDDFLNMLCPEVGINESDRFLCTVCQKTFLNKRTFKAHALRHRPKIHPCEKCGKKFATEKELERHVYEHANNVCSVCGKEIASKMGLKIHMRIHTGERPYACSYKNCPKRFTQINALKNHLSVHLGERNFKCSFCDKAFVQITSLQGHERIHMNLKQYVCRYCERGFNDPSAFARHERTHTGDKRYKCPHCPMAFTDASGLIVHKRRHTGIRDYKCSKCDKAFFIKSDLTKHEFLHTKQTAVECHICGLQFALKQYLKLHIKVMHVETKKVSCKLCKKKLKPHYMANHMAIVHDIHPKSKRVKY